MMSRYVITGRATSTGCSVMRFMSRPRQPLLQTMSPVPHTLTTSRASVTKAGGLSDVPGAERSPNGGDEDTVTYSRFGSFSNFADE